ncbi:transmembrane protein 44 [Notolabrus celidotus]|uniref:transmembrane protein 44 n=1 Tax=Notolabrus celidotus TaxID=1203425 RepID=UPI00148F704F|nr:transmembrane protein 44 [Notolabrus celidotus]
MEVLDVTRGNFNTFLTNLANFCINSVSTCLSLDADKRCIAIGLSCLSALLLLLSCFLLVYQRYMYRRENPGGTLTSFYSFLGNMCSTVGAILSSQLYILMLMGAFAAAVDVIHVISCCFHLFLCWNSQAEKRQRMIKNRRRQHLLAMCVLLVVGGFLKPLVDYHPAQTPLGGRKLLHVTLQDNTEILGYILGVLSFVISCTSRLPAINRSLQGQMLTWVHMSSGLLSSSASALYASAILLYDSQFTFVLRVLPWLLSAICCVHLDLLIIVICWCKRGRQQLTTLSPDTESLLGCPGLFPEDNTDMKKHRKQRVNSSAQTKNRSVQKTADMGCYMDVSVQSARKKCLPLETLSKEEMEDQPLHGTVRVIRFNSFCSSDTSYDSLLESSDLEWDFEEANARWNEPTAKQQEKVKFALQEWLKHPKPCKPCTYSMFRPSQKTLPGENNDE